VLKLFQIVQPDRAYFGEKDAQQLAIVRQMVTDFNSPVVIVGVPTVREADGLALSSRNRRLQPNERLSATALYRTLREAERQITAGLRDVAQIKAHARTAIRDEHGLRLEYLEIVDPETLQPVEQITGPVLVAGALWVGTTRLIDNLYCTPPHGESSEGSA
jgi:pantoate--beta-alanine ligase